MTLKPCFPSYLLLPPATQVWGKVMFLHLCVILFTGGACRHTWVGWADPPGCRPHLDRPPWMQPPLGIPPWMQTPPMQTPPMQTPLDADPPPGYVNKRAVRILLECILVFLKNFQSVRTISRSSVSVNFLGCFP